VAKLAGINLIPNGAIARASEEVAGLGAEEAVRRQEGRPIGVISVANTASKCFSDTLVGDKSAGARVCAVASELSVVAASTLRSDGTHVTALALGVNSSSALPVVHGGVKQGFAAHPAGAFAVSAVLAEGGTGNMERHRARITFVSSERHTRERLVLVLRPGGGGVATSRMHVRRGQLPARLPLALVAHHPLSA
jgi:hypothetical protein